MRSLLSKFFSRSFRQFSRDDRGNVESFLVLIPLTMLFLGVLTLLLYLQIRISALGVVMTLAREASLSTHFEESQEVAHSKLRQVGVMEPIIIRFQNGNSAGIDTVVVSIEGRTAVGIPISLEVTAAAEQ